MKAAEITRDFVEGWSLSGLQGVAEEKSPALYKLLHAGVQIAHTRNKGRGDPMVVSPALPHASLPNAAQVISVIICQIAHHRSHHAIQSQTLLGLFWWSSGASRQGIHTLQRCGLSISYDSIDHILSEHSLNRLEEARLITQSPYLTTYDNINIGLSPSHKQHEDAPSKVQSGTVAFFTSCAMSIRTTCGSRSCSSVTVRARTSASPRTYNPTQPAWEHPTSVHRSSPGHHSSPLLHPVCKQCCYCRSYRRGIK
jgi:hypothetical protein